MESRVLVAARKFEALEIAKPGEALAELNPVEILPRTVTEPNVLKSS
jgi:hypothetical protein